MPEIRAPSHPPYTLPVASAVPAFHRECRTYGPPATSPSKRRAYEFAPIPVFPIRRGPVLADRARTGWVRTHRDVRRFILDRVPELEACWAWASARGAPPVTLDLAMTIDPFGETTDVALTSTAPVNAELVACVRAQLATTRSPRVVSHATRITAKLALQRVDQPPPRKRAALPARPPASPVEPAHAGEVCTPVLDDQAPHTIPLETPFVLLDVDPAREDRMTAAQRTKLAAARAGSARCTNREVFETDKVHVRQALMGSHGSYQACYAAARERDPALTGAVTLTFLFAQPGGLPSTVTAAGAGDPALHECLKTAGAEVWLLPPPTDLLEVVWPLQLSAPVNATTVDELLAGGDPAGALALLAAQLNAEPSPAARCALHVQVVLASAQLAPWLDDDRLGGAIANLAAALQPLTAGERTTCLATGGAPERRPPLELLAQRIVRATKFRTEQAFATTTWLRRYALVLPLAPYLPWGTTLRWNHALALAAVDRETARATLVELEQDPELGEKITESIAHIDQSPDPLDAICP